MLKTILKIVAFPQLLPHCGIIWNLDTKIINFRCENNSTPGVLMEEIIMVCKFGIEIW